MLLQLGNAARRHAIDDAPAVTYASIPDSYTLEPGMDADELRRDLDRSMRTRDGITSMPNHEALLVATHPFGMWPSHSVSGTKGPVDPTWVASDNPELERFLSEYYGIPAGVPEGVHDTHWTRIGNKDLAPGVGPWAAPVEALLTNVGRSLWANALGGGSTGTAGTATSTTATTLVNSGATWGVNQWAGYRVYAGTTWGNVVSNTATTLTVDQWYGVPDTGAAGSTPAGTTSYIIASGGSVAAWYIGVTSTNITPAATDTSLSGEATTNGMGRKISPFALTSGTTPASYTLTPVFTYTGSTPTTFYAIAAFTSAVKADGTDTMMFETSLNTSFTVSANGDQATITETVTGS